jgi:hypothetical protein
LLPIGGYRSLEVVGLSRPTILGSWRSWPGVAALLFGVGLV